MNVFNTLKNDDNVVTGYGYFEFTTKRDAEMAIKLSEAHAENVMNSYRLKMSRDISEITDKFNEKR